MTIKRSKRSIYNRLDVTAYRQQFDVAAEENHTTLCVCVCVCVF